MLSERAVVVAGSADEALAGLRAVARGEDAAGVVVGRAGTPGKTVWVFPGQGAQWVGMGRELLAASPVFAERVAECAVALEPWVDWSLLDVLRGQAAPELLDRVDVVQPASFAMMVGLAEVWRSCGLRPDAVVGHSQGEIAAACVAGALSLTDAARVVALRSQAIATVLAGGGGMASVALSEADAVVLLAPWADRVQVAAINSPTGRGAGGAGRCGRPGAPGGGRLRLTHQPGGRHPRPARRGTGRRDRAGACRAVLLHGDRRLGAGSRCRGRRLLVPQPA
jgi:rifamycin polyketide synthase module 4/5/6